MSESRPSSAFRRRLQILHEMGLSPLWQLRESRSVGRSAPVDRDRTPIAQKPEAVLAPPVNKVDRGTAGDRAEVISHLDWESLRASIADCHACRLCEKRQQAVPGVGDLEADWLFIGEGPGAEEDARGEPFVGAAGRLLDAMLAAIDLRRGQDVYIANAVKCRPPNNRTPETSEIAACAPYLRRQIVLLQPRLIVLLGRVAVHALLGEVGSLSSLRGQLLHYRKPEDGGAIPIVVTYHPAYLLRTLPDKAKSWEDLCRARTLMHAAKALATQIRSPR